ncbi:PQQ-dependent sugar dehydrogenase [Chenggangzhangella methanolivorans]|uniref:PQQ-dependent sugar dehydrogenase n=1 Tax=Chenggangzhangella methanolivorans TaxID=1437009 RepID=A0A9E6REW3_9HYPH|nr:PQQ-dependent sugar dehydrogenase [Chenggangzhangella methanolivorans]
MSPGKNYGWPIVTGGLDYTFARVSPFRDLPAMSRRSSNGRPQSRLRASRSTMATCSRAGAATYWCRR